MIVRDEAEVIARCVASALPLISSWTICDTGSRDGTPEAIEELLGHLPGELHHTAWRDFGQNRSELMALARGSADYLLLIDADMTVEANGQLPELEADAYLLAHGGDLSYWIPRLVRADLPWRYVGSTHEYLTLDRDFDQRRLTALTIAHWGDGGARAEKFERDAKLLQRDLRESPDDPRTLFYLAQTMRDMGWHEEALELYLRRVGAGGWEEEAFYAAYQAGMLQALADPQAARRQLAASYELRPSRAEPLLELSRLARYQGRYDDALAHAEQGLGIPEPDDLLFVHHDVYRWQLRHERAIARYWLGDHAGAIRDCDELLASTRLTPEERGAVAETRAYSVAALPPGLIQRRAAGWGEPLGSLLPDLAQAEIVLEIDPDWPCFNPSIAADEGSGGFRMIVRSANYQIVDGRYQFIDDGDQTIRTLNYLTRLDAELELVEVEPLVDSGAGPQRHDAPVRGFEDCRLVRIGDRWLASATVRDRSPDAVCRIALLDLAGSEIASLLVLEGPEPGRHEKNWMPIARGDGLQFVYTSVPTIVLDCDPRTGTLSERSREPAAGAGLGELRGGSQLIAVDGGLLAVVHEIAEVPGHGRVYSHRLVLFDDEGPLRIGAISPRFRFTAEPIELCAGIARSHGRLILSFGIGDHTAALAITALDSALGLLEAL